jgi:hypothetical protein
VKSCNFGSRAMVRSRQMADDWESALRKLTRKPPSSEVMQTITAAMRGCADDRSAALLSAALADAAILSAIANALRPDEPEHWQLRGFDFRQGLPQASRCRFRA